MSGDRFPMLIKRTMQKRDEVKKLRIRLSEAQNHRCAYCHKSMDVSDKENYNNDDVATIEHVIRKVDGGLDFEDNLVAACKKCNGGRFATPALNYYGRINPDYVTNPDDRAFFGVTMKHFERSRKFAHHPEKLDGYVTVLAEKFREQQGMCANCGNHIPFLGGRIHGHLYGTGDGIATKRACCKKCKRANMNIILA